VSRIKPAEVRFYIDADLLGLARVLADLRAATLHLRSHIYAATRTTMRQIPLT